MTLREVYAHKGEYTAKLIIDPKESQDIDSVRVDMRNSDGHAMDFTAKRWGTKLTVSFVIDDQTPDGVAVIDVTLSGRDWPETRERFDLWIIK